DEESCENNDVPKGLFQLLRVFFGCQEPAAEPMTVDPVPAGSEPMSPTLPEGSPSGKCQEDEHYHHHYPCCPYTGRCYPEDSTPSPAVPDVSEEKKVDKKSSPTKDKEEDQPPARKDSASEESNNNRHPEFRLDTMEFRPSDAGLHRFIPGAL